MAAPLAVIKSLFGELKTDFQAAMLDKGDTATKITRAATFMTVNVAVNLWFVTPKLIKYALEPEYAMGRADFIEFLGGLGLFAFALYVLRRRDF